MSEKGLPPLTPLEFAVMRELSQMHEDRAQEIKTRIERRNINHSPAALYMLLGRLCKKGLITQRKQKSESLGYVVQESLITLTDKGLTAVADTSEFYVL